jgi:hypothetical protein
VAILTVNQSHELDLCRLNIISEFPFTNTYWDAYKKVKDNRRSGEDLTGTSNELANLITAVFLYDWLFNKDTKLEITCNLEIRAKDVNFNSIINQVGKANFRTYLISQVQSNKCNPLFMGCSFGFRDINDKYFCLPFRSIKNGVLIHLIEKCNIAFPGDIECVDHEAKHKDKYQKTDITNIQTFIQANYRKANRILEAYYLPFYLG